MRPPDPFWYFPVGNFCIRFKRRVSVNFSIGIAVKNHTAPGVLVRFICDTCAICHNKGISIYPGFKAAANGRSIFFSGLGRGVHGAAADQDPTCFTDRSIVFWGILAADARVPRPAGGRYRTAADGDLAAGGAESAVTNARCAICAGGRDCAAADGDLAAGSLCPAADARGTLPIFALIAPFRGDRAASDGYACNFSGFSSAIPSPMPAPCSPPVAVTVPPWIKTETLLSPEVLP